nr:HAMP domain-containing sensor histidine kinase [Helicobacter kayseriensis]
MSFRGVFIGIFCALFVLFAGVSYQWNVQSNTKQAILDSQTRIQHALFALKSIDPKEINQDNLQSLSEGLGVELLVVKKDRYISSSPQSIQKQNFKESSSPIYEDGMVYQVLYLRDKMLVLYMLPQIRVDGLNLVIFCVFMLCVICICWLFYVSFKEQFEQILSPTQKGKAKSLLSLRFGEMQVFSEQLQKLEKILARRDQKTLKQTQKIKLKNEQLSNLLSAISHELKNPLSIIQLSLDGLENPKIEQKDLFYQKIRHQVVRLNQLTHKLNFVFNLDIKQVQFEEFDLFEVVQGIIQAQDNHRIKLLGETTFVRGDVFLIEQVVINLISNALKYSQDEILIEIKDGKFKITDYGIGITQEQIKKVTKKFYKANPESENSFGLGLFIVKKILTLHQSRLKIKSKPNEETSFAFRL